MNNLQFPSQHLSKNVKEWSEKHNLCQKTIRRDFKDLGLSKTRAQYEQDAKTRRETAYNLRQQGLKYRVIAEMLSISTDNAKKLVRRHHCE